jgi:hypothetical protein
MKIRKYNGELIEFQPSKLRGSLLKSGASPDVVDLVMDQLKSHLFDGMSSSELYKKAHKALQNQQNSFAARYSLKRALQELGPAGYYFEMWISKFLQTYGYQTLHSQIIAGKAVTHEADVIACKEDDLFWIECKFRNTDDSKISVTTPMYLLSRVQDISDIEHQLFNRKMRFTKGWLITNAILTTDSLKFGTYYGLKMLSWDYPSGKSLKNLVDLQGLYPITCLTTLHKEDKEALLKRGCLMVRELHEKPSLLHVLNRKEAELKEIIQEVNDLVS